MTCQWAGCTRTDTTLADGWHHCGAHLVEHYELMGSGTTSEMVLALHSQGLTDSEIARRLGRDDTTISYHRQRMGLPPNRYRRKEPEHGTPAGYKQHRRLGTPACEPCRAANRARLAAYRRAS